MSLTIQIKSATDLPNLEKFGKSDPICIVRFQGQKVKTVVVNSDLNPQWNETHTLKLATALRNDDALAVNIFDWERAGSNKLMAQADISLRECISSGGMEVDMPLKSGHGERLSATIQLAVSYQPPAGQAQAGRGESSAPAGSGVENSGQDADSVDNADVDGYDVIDVDVHGEEPAIDQLDTPGGGGAGSIPGVVVGNDQGKGSRRSTLHRRKANRANLPKKPCDFKVRIHVSEARKLVGQNINPMCNIRVHDTVQHTAVKKATNRPFFDQTFYFNFHMAPREFLDKVISFEVMKSRALRADSLIGTFQFDCGFCYDFENHAIVEKWLLLTDPAVDGARGYLKISCAVAGPTDDMKPFPRRTVSDSVDLESNLLRPAGVQLAPCTFTVRLYRAEDIPQMDSAMFEGVKKVFGAGSKERKELVDPYVVVNFAGNSSRTSVQYNRSNPDWNEELQIGCKFPSMCDRLRLRIKDRDNYNKDDTVGTAYLNLSDISAPGETGFLPTFGPAWINVYGSPREYSDLVDERDYLNMGLLEGVAYRGRMLVEVLTEVGKYPEATGAVPIDDSSVELVNCSFLRPKKYELRAAFMDGGLLPQCVADSPVSFEISIGNYGNTLDPNVPPATSTTQPTNPVSDGEYYYYLPWGKSKPCVSVHCALDDIPHRVGAVNLLLHIANRLEQQLKEATVMAHTGAPESKKARAFIDMMDSLEEDLKNPRLQVPDVSEGLQGVTKLDLQIHEIRKQELCLLKESAHQLRRSATNINVALTEVENCLCRLRNLVVEGQNSIPDVVIWMLQNKRRVAYARVPAHEVMYLPHADGSKWREASGRNCGKPQTVYLQWPPKKDNTSPKHSIAAQLRLVIWLGPEHFLKDWSQCTGEGEISVYGETYENQSNVFGWGKSSLSRPAFSDVNGKMSQEKEQFEEPAGWAWSGDWFVNPELSLSFSQDIGKSEFVEDVFEYQQRIPGTSWTGKDVFWGNVCGNEVTARDEMELETGWQWKDVEWTVDKNRACDEEGFEYSVDPSMAGYTAVERMYHLCRRRRWTRRRVRTLTAQQLQKQVSQEEKATEGWEYSRLFNTKFHAKKRKIDMVRRRRWHRKLMALEGASVPSFSFPDAGNSDVKHRVSPRMFMSFNEPRRYQLRVYLYQARNVRSSDSTGLSDPYCRVAIGRHSAKSITLKETIMPTWDQTLILNNIELCGDPNLIAPSPPDVVVELFDYDVVGKDEFLGRCAATPHVSLSRHSNPVLEWFPLTYFGKDGGQLLAAFHLMLCDGSELPFAPEHMPPPNAGLFRLPSGIRPEMQVMRVEALCWGVRDLDRCQLLSVEKPFVTISAGGQQLKTDTIRKIKRCPNYAKPLLVFDRVELPKELLYMPPISIQIFDNRAFGRTPLVGTHSVSDIVKYQRGRFSAMQPAAQKVPEGKYVTTSVPEHVMEVHMDETVEPLSDVNKTLVGRVDSRKPLAMQEPFYDEPVAPAALADKPAKEVDEEERKSRFVDWWSKYYASAIAPGEVDPRSQDYLDKYNDRIVVYKDTLEIEFDGFTDFLDTFEIFRGKGQQNEDSQDRASAGKFKGMFCVYPLPEDGSTEPPLILENVPSSSPQQCIVRVYIVKAEDLEPQDRNGKNDSYVRICLGKERVVNDNQNYIANSLDPVFGKMFEIKATLPVEHQLRVQLMDWDLLSADDLIGETVIDLEDRFLTKHRATCGLSSSYCIDGTNVWRDSQRPTDILSQVCRRNGFPEPSYTGDMKCHVAGQLYQLFAEDDAVAPTAELGPMRERLALKVLHHFNVVPEHLELRPLYKPLRPHMQCGKLQMWVDIFPANNGLPPAPVNITPRKPEQYELRVIIHNVVEVPLQEAATVTGEMMSDIYLKGWLRDTDKKHKTDVHYRSLNGEGNFNWRWIMPFEYIPAEKLMVIKKKDHFYSWDKTESRRPAVLQLQVWDNDLFSLDDYIGSSEFNLTSLPPPAKTSEKCCQEQFGDLAAGAKPVKAFVNLFQSKRLRGWWPMRDVDKDGTLIHAGKVEMELEIVTQEEAALKPAGEARDDPNTNPVLDPPNRPKTSFLWFTNPFKTLRYVIWRRYKWHILIFLLVTLAVAALVIFFYSAPGYGMRKAFGFQ